MTTGQKKELGKANASIPSLKDIKVKDGKETSVNVALKSPVKVWVENGMDTGKLTITPTLDKKKVTDDQVTAPINKGTTVGSATIQLADDKLGYLEANKSLRQTSSPLLLLKKLIFLSLVGAISQIFSVIYFNIMNSHQKEVETKVV